MNKLGIVHRDIKPANIFMSKNLEIKIGDFNVSTIKRKNELLSKSIGTPYYLAPEMWLGKGYTENCDIYSLGCLLYELY